MDLLLTCSNSSSIFWYSLGCMATSTDLFFAMLRSLARLRASFRCFAIRSWMILRRSSFSRSMSSCCLYSSSLESSASAASTPFCQIRFSFSCLKRFSSCNCLRKSAASCCLALLSLLMRSLLGLAELGLPSILSSHSIV